MEPFKAQGFLEADSPGFSRRDKSKIPYKEDAILKDSVFFDALQLPRKRFCDTVSKV